MERDMTQGSPAKLIIQFAIPLLIGNIMQQTYNVVDAAIVGRILGPNALAGVGASSSVQFLILGFCIGVCCGFAVPIAQRFGAKDMDSMRRYLFHGYLLAALIAVVLTITCTALVPQILHLLSTPNEIYQDAYDYLFVIFLGIPCNILYNLLSGYLRSIGDSKTPFIFLTISTILNIGLDILCIASFGWGVTGAAIATISAQGLSGLLCLIVIIRKVEILHLRCQDCKPSGSYFGKMLSMGVPMGLQYSITAIGSMVMQSANNGLGSVYVSGFTAGMKIKQFALCPFDAIATGVSVFCGQNMGAGEHARIRKGFRQGLFIAVGYGIFIGVILMTCGRTLSMIFMDASETAILDASGEYLFCMGTCYWSLAILNVCRMTVQGLGFSGRTIMSGVTEMIARIAVSLLAVPHFGYDAICWADQVAWISACMYILPMALYCIKKVSQAPKTRLT